MVNQVRESKGPLIQTQNGKSFAVLVDVAEYQSIIDKLELLQDIQLAEQQIVKGKYLSDSQVEKRLTSRYGNEKKLDRV